MIRSGTQLTAEVLEGQSRLKAIVRAGVGVDNIDVAAATRRGIVVMNTPGGNTISTAEHTMALLLSLARNVAQANDSLKAGKWDRNKFTGHPARRQDAGRHRPGPGRAGGGQAGAGVRDDGRSASTRSCPPTRPSSTASRASRGSTTSGAAATSSRCTRR